jgi:HAD superfamily hydrolase (TIGR01509 family)
MSMSEQRAVVWDLDGVMVDSADAHNRSWVAMAKRFDVPYDPDRDFAGIFGRHNNDIISSMWQVNNQAQIDEMADYKESSFREEAAHLVPLPGVVELVKALREAGWKQAIGSSAPLLNVQALLDGTGLGQYMDAISSGNDVTEGKPNPEVFLIAFRRLGVDPRDGVVVEDAPAGVLGGRRAGAAVLAVTTTQTADLLREAGADRIEDTLTGITVADMEALVQANRERAGA